MFSIVAVIPPLYVRRLERALPGEVEIASCANLADCQTPLEDSSVDCMVVDPLLLDEKEMGQLLHTIRSRRVPVIFYTTLTSAAVTQMLPALREGAAEIIFADIEDYPQRFRQVFHSLPSVSLGASLVSALAPELPRLHPTVRLGLVAILLDPSLTSTKELPAHASISRRTMERELARAQLAPLHRWWSVSRLARSFGGVKEGSLSDTEAAKLAGYASARSLDQQYRKIMHVPLAEARQALSQRKFVKLAARALREPRTRAA